MIVLSMFFLVGCGNGSTDGDADTDVTEETGEDPTPELEIDPACEYPAGPYGTSEGDIIDNLAWDVVVGGGSVSLRQFHCDPSTKLLLLYGTAGWCPNCPYESAALPDLYDEYHSQGLEIIALVFEDLDGDPADLSFAEDYQVEYGFPFTTVADYDSQIGNFEEPSSAPINVFVDLDTMEILFSDPGYDESTLRTRIETFLDI
jgi:hypothetical protein